MRNKVVFPHPEGPHNRVNDPIGKEIETFLSDDSLLSGYVNVAFLTSKRTNVVVPPLYTISVFREIHPW
jgi:hypothetical protein